MIISSYLRSYLLMLLHKRVLTAFSEAREKGFREAKRYCRNKCLLLLWIFFFLRDVYLTQSDNSNQTQVLTDDQHVNRNTKVQTRLTGNFVEKKMVARATGICRWEQSFPFSFSKVRLTRKRRAKGCKKLGAGRRGWEAGCWKTCYRMSYES